MSASRESAEDLHYQYQYISVPQMEYDPGEDRDRDTDQVSKAYYEAPADDGEIVDLNLEGIEIPPEAHTVVIKVLERVADFYFNAPHTLDALFHTIFKGKTQSDIAREKNISRQCENKRLLRELGIAQKRNDIQERRDRELGEKKRELDNRLDELHRRDEFLSSLNERDWMIYKLAFVDGCTLGSVAKQLGVGARTVDRVARFLRLKLGQNGAIKRGRRKKSRKNCEDNN